MWCGVWTSLGILSVQPSVSTPARRPVLASWRSEVEGNRCLRPEEGEEPFLLFFPRRLPTTQAQSASQPASKLQGIDRLDRGGRSIDRSIDTVSALKMSVKNRRVRCQVLEKACEINAVERGRYPGTNWSHERASPVKRRGKIIVSISNENYSGSYSSNLSRK